MTLRGKSSDMSPCRPPVCDRERSDSQRWRLKLYRDDSETTVVFENVKHAFLTGGNTVLTIAQYADDGSHHYVNYPRERVCWWKLERVR